MTSARAIASIAACAALLAGVSRADVVTIPCARDNTLFNDSTGGTSNGSGPDLIVGRAGASAAFPVRRALLAFDLATWVPAGATINSAQLVLRRSHGNNVPRVIEVHAVLAAWGEGASNAGSGQGAPAQPGDATWLHRFHPTLLWTAPGGDFAAAASAQQSVDGPGFFAFGPTPALTADAQGWLDLPASNFGWLLRDADETPSQTTHVFGSREATDPASRPMLVIDFTPAQSVFAFCPAQPNSLGCSPAIGWSGAASASAGSGFQVSLGNALSQRFGILCYSTLGTNAAPLYGGTLCILPPTRRSMSLFSGGNPQASDCSGAFDVDFNARIASGLDPQLVPGARVWCQFLSRDPALVGGVHLSNALRFEIGP